MQWLTGFILRFQARFNIPERAVAQLVVFLFSFFTALGRFSNFVAGLAEHFPASLYRLRKMVKSDSSFTKYVVCPKCEQLYHRGSCIRKIGSREESVTCCYSEFPNHPSRSRQQCGHRLLKSVHLVSGRAMLYPFKV